ncbi:MAG: short-chain dehydrogenase [Halorubrum sp. J07HR59]|jgi:Short-chain alcohol dehydrogenase of unknown specificity|nr:MAG: short-chain dehydrogenase [halophilic archaeon J07HX5]ERH04857.1 MAG: short-chain dehydrogenase [Halorubrum sp. J07HR59]
MAEITYDYGDETVVITGASSGIGRATAMRFGAAGATVVNADLREEPKDDNAETPTHVAIEDAGGTARFVRTDVTDPAEVQAVIEAAHEFGGVDIMVNNAATHYTGSFLDVDPDELDRLLSVNVRGVLVGSQAAARDMIERDKSGVI